MENGNLLEQPAWLDACSEIAFYKDEKGKFVWVNKAMAELLGVSTCEAAKGKSDFDFFPRETSQKLWDLDKRIIRDAQAVSSELHSFRLPNHQMEWYSISRYPQKNDEGKVIGIYAIGAKVTHLKDQNFLMEYLINNIPDTVYFKGVDGKFLWANKFKLGKHMLHKVEEIQGKTDFDFFPKEKAKATQEDENRIMDSGSAVLGKEEIEVTPDGDRRWVSTSKIPLKDMDGRVIGTCGISRDITRIKLAEERLEILMDNIPDPIYFKDEKSRFTLINKACASGFGLKDPSQAYGKTDFDFFSAEHAQPSFDDEQKVIQSGVPIIGKEELETWSDGRYTWALTTKLPLRDHHGRIVGTFGLTRDITKIKQAEEQLQSLMDHIPDSIYFKDMKSHFLRINQAFARKLGLNSPDEAAGKTDFDFFAREHAQAAFDDERSVMDGKEVIGKEEFVSWPKATPSWVSCTKLQLRNPTGALIGTFGLSRDISGLKKVEEELQKAKENLEIQVMQRTAELREANQGMEIRIRQLNYLNQKAHYLASLMHKERLHKAIFDTFVERFPMGQVHLADVVKTEWVTVYTTTELQKADVLATCIQALGFMEISDESVLYFENRWMENPLLENVFHSDLREYPCYLEVPLVTDKRLRGVIQVFAPREFEEKFKQEQPLLNTLAAQIAVALDNANHYAEVGEKTRIQSELEIAQRIQKRYIPEDPVMDRIKLKGICQPANEVGGDYLDYFQNDRGDWVVVIADVCGKGIPAALVMTSLRSIFRTEARKQTSSKSLMCVVNKYMAKDLQLDNSFITCLCLIIDKDGNSFNCARAGHPMMLAHSRNGAGKPMPVKSDGIALGMIIDDTFDKILTEVTVELHPGDRFLAYTDGLTESMNKNRDSYGTQKLVDLMDQTKDFSLRDQIAALLDDLRKFSQDTKPHDDLTLFVFERTD